MCVVRGGNVTPGPLTRGPGRVSGYPSEGRMSPPPYAGHQLAACTHAPCAPCAPRSQVHVLGAPVSYKRISAKCAIICTFFMDKSHVQKYATCALVPYIHAAPVLCTKVCTSYMHKSNGKSMHTCAMLTNTETSRTSVGERAEISTKESTSNITISFVQSISHQKIQTFFNSRPLVLSASLPWGAGTSIVLFTLLSKWGQLSTTLHF